jgi:FtsZ-interacting cell division protein ZipA
MKRKEIIQLLLIAVVTMMFTACAASRRVVSDNHQEVKDSVSAIQQDSVHQQVMVNDSVAIKVSEDKHTSSSSTEAGEYEETIQEQITETTDSSGNKQTTTNRTTHRKGSYSNQSSYEERLQMQQQEINQMQKTIDSLAVSSRNDVCTHWAATDSLSDTQEKNTAETRKATWIQKARKNVLAMFLILVVVLLLTTIKKHTDNGKGKI